MTQIKLDYLNASVIVDKMKTDSDLFQNNQNELLRIAVDLGNNWSGDISNTMQAELKDMNKVVANIQTALNELATLARKSIEVLQYTDTAISDSIKGN